MTLAYPVGDLVIAFVVIHALHRMGMTDRLALWCLFAGLIALALADSTFAYVVQVEGYATGNLLDAGWFAGYLGIALGGFATSPRDLPVQAESAFHALPSLVAPLLPMLVALSVAAVTIDLDVGPDWVALIILVVLILLALLRQVLLLVDLARISGAEGAGSVIDRIGWAVLSHRVSEAADAEARSTAGHDSGSAA